MPAPLRFRIFNKKARTMYPPEFFALRLDGVQLIAMPRDVWYVDNPDFTIVMQSTGLKDKNGLEIFEGDVTCWAAEDIDGEVSTETYVVSWDEERARFQSTAIGKDVDADEVDSDVEVIGNIYENPDLLLKP